MQPCPSYPGVGLDFDVSITISFVCSPLSFVFTKRSAQAAAAAALASAATHQS